MVTQLEMRMWGVVCECEGERGGIWIGDVVNGTPGGGGGRN